MQDASKPIWITEKKKVPNVSTLPSIFVATPVHSECSIHYTKHYYLFNKNVWLMVF
jgi:hypothetical protein